MRHLLLCPEYPSAPHPGGIGTYAFHLGNLLSEAGETVHIVCRCWKGNGIQKKEFHNGRLVIHRIPDIRSEVSDILSHSSYAPQSFSWEAGLYMERLISEENIDLIESQEYEAPLFYFQIRRLLGLGPKILPPCVVHLHSPTELIARHNGWEHHHFDWRFARRLELFSIAAADAILSPSSHLARFAEEALDLVRDEVRIIRYPKGEGEHLTRDDTTWREGAICYVGRFERRKGILEWMEVAVDAARSNPRIKFEFIGRNNLERDIRKLIPEDLRHRVLMHGEQSHFDLPKFLSRARIAVVPSRWENFPYSCIEAMASGLPVLATANGGMAEIIEDGRTGWLTKRNGKEGLAEALHRALRTPPETLQQMGQNAVQQIEAICGNTRVLHQHLEFRTAVMRSGIRTLNGLLARHFPELAGPHPSALQRFIREQPVSIGKRTADLIRRMKRKMKVPVPSAISQDVYRFLSRK